MASRSSDLQCVWFKRDLRISDHRPLVEAANAGPVLAIFIIEPAVVEAPDYGEIHGVFQAQALRELDAALKKLGNRLVVRRGEAVEVLEAIRSEIGFQALWSHEETGNEITYRRDREVGIWAKNRGVVWTEISQNGVIRGLCDRDGWAGLWRERMKDAPLDAPIRLRERSGQLVSEEIPNKLSNREEGWVTETDMVGGEIEGRAVLDSFIEGRGKGYRKKMSSPVTAYDHCSRLSPYFSWGCLSIRSAVARVREAMGKSLPRADGNSFLSRCHWHCHFMQKLEAEPEIEHHCFNRACENLRPRNPDPERLEAWCSGQTGYPFLDACMRSLRTRGWINFRMRAMLVSFAAYDLWLDWRSFKDFLARQFIDYEPGIHFSQVQMQSGVTGINTLRIYSPVKQGRDQDPSGGFIRRWVPELSSLSEDQIHEPWLVQSGELKSLDIVLGRHYPRPIVDHQTAVKKARLAFSELRNMDEFWEEAARVNRRHGSRRPTEKRPKRRKKESAQQEFTLQ